MSKRSLNLPRGWYWSYILRPHRSQDGEKYGWCLCAVCYLGRSKQADGLMLGLYNEVYIQKRTRNEAVRAIITKIKAKDYKTRWIHFPDEG